jgi:hypothetical protein
MSGYIRFDKDTVEDPRLLGLADDLNAYLDIALGEAAEKSLTAEFPGALVAFSDTDARNLLCNAMLGGLVHLWVYGDTHIQTGDSLPLTVGALAAVMRLPEWTVHLFPRDWLIIDEENRRVILPGFIAKNNINPRDIRKDDKNLQRIVWREKKRRQRAKKRGDSPPETDSGTPLGTCLPVHPPVPRTPVPVPLPLTRNRDRGTESAEIPRQHDALASAQGHLARRTDANKRGEEGPKPNGHAGEGKGGSPGSRTATHTLAELEAFALRCADAGEQSDDIAKMLRQHGVTAEQVRKWISNRPPPSTPEGSA